jgi:hypothetical protein
LWLGLAPAAFGLHLLRLYPLTGSLLGPALAQQAWARDFAWPWQSIFNPSFIGWYITPLDVALALAAVPLAVVAGRLLKSPAYTAQALLLMVPPLFTGTVSSLNRFALGAFPLFVAAAVLGEWRRLGRWAALMGMLYQLALMAAWARFYWVA